MSDDEDVDIDLKYKQLKEVEPLIMEQYLNGEISEREYLDFIEAIAEYEDE